MRIIMAIAAAVTGFSISTAAQSFERALSEQEIIAAIVDTTPSYVAPSPLTVAPQACPFPITYSDGTTDCLRQSLQDPSLLPAKRRTINLNIPFDNASSKLKPLAMRNLDMLARVYHDPKNGLNRSRFQITGHASAPGDEYYNMLLSEERASAVVGYLVSMHGIPSSQIVAYGLGETAHMHNVPPHAPQQRRVMLEVVR